MGSDRHWATLNAMPDELSAARAKVADLEIRLAKLTSAQSADKEQIWQTVINAVLDVSASGPALSSLTLSMLASAIAARAAEQLATAAVRLSMEEVESLLSIRADVKHQADYWHGKEGGVRHVEAVAVLDRLIAAHRSQP